MTRQTRLLMKMIYFAFVLYLFIPLSMMILMGFKDSKFIGFPVKSLTLDWYKAVISDMELLSIFGYSFTIAITSTLFALVIGTWAAMLLSSASFKGKVIIFALVCLPAVIPGIISAIALRIYSQTLGIEPGMMAVILGHTIHNVPFVHWWEWPAKFATC